MFANWKKRRAEKAEAEVLREINARLPEGQTLPAIELNCLETCQSIEALRLSQELGLKTDRQNPPAQATT